MLGPVRRLSELLVRRLVHCRIGFIKMPAGILFQSPGLLALKKFLGTFCLGHLGVTFNGFVVLLVSFHFFAKLRTMLPVRDYSASALFYNFYGTGTIIVS